MGQSDRPVRVVLVEDERLFRDLLRTVLDEVPQVEVVGTFAQASSAIAGAIECRPDVAIVDLELDDGWTGVRVATELRRALPGIGIVILSNHAHPHLLTTLDPAATVGWSYLVKRSVADVGAVVRAVEGSAHGHGIVGPRLDRPEAQRSPPATGRLTRRQGEILELIAQGCSNATIARRLALAEKTVENQINLLYQALAIDHGAGHRQARIQATLAFLGVEPGPAGSRDRGAPASGAGPGQPRAGVPSERRCSGQASGSRASTDVPLPPGPGPNRQVPPTS